MKPRFENKSEQLNISFSNNYKVFFYKEGDRKYRMRIFIPTEPGSINGGHFGHIDWSFNKRKDFFRRKSDVLNVIYKVFKDYKLYILKNIFEWDNG